MTMDSEVQVGFDLWWDNFPSLFHLCTGSFTAVHGKQN